MLVIIIIFLAITFTLAGVLVMGAVPKIFQTGEQVNQTQTTLNQTHLFLMEQEARDNQTKYEDQARLNQTIFQIQHEDLAREIQQQTENTERDKQRYLIINETNTSLNRLEDNIMLYINESTERSLQGAQERQKIMDEILNISKQHDKVAKDHDMISREVGNVTNKVDQNLYRYGENSIKQLQEIIDNQKLIFQMLNNNNETKK